MIKVVMQKNVNVRTETKAFATTYSGFFNFLSEENIKEFLFCPTQDRDELKRVSQRVKKVEAAGYTVSDNNDLSYYKTAVRGL